MSSSVDSVISDSSASGTPSVVICVQVSVDGSYRPTVFGSVTRFLLLTSVTIDSSQYNAHFFSFRSTSRELPEKTYF